MTAICSTAEFSYVGNYHLHHHKQQREHSQQVTSPLSAKEDDRKFDSQLNTFENIVSNDVALIAEIVEDGSVCFPNGTLHQMDCNADWDYSDGTDLKSDFEEVNREASLKASEILIVPPLGEFSVDTDNSGCFSINNNADDDVIKDVLGGFEFGPFEGVEKRFIIEFHQNVLNSSPYLKEGSLKSLSSSQLQLMLNKAGCQILSHRVLETSNGSCTAYLLSESSLFVFKNCIILKTCGTTTPLLSLPVLLNFVTGVLDQTSQSHKSGAANSHDDSLLISKCNTVLHHHNPNQHHHHYTSSPPPSLCLARDSFDAVSLASGCSTTETTAEGSLVSSLDSSTSLLLEHSSSQEFQQSPLFSSPSDKQQQRVNYEAFQVLLDNHIRRCDDEGKVTIEEQVTRCFNCNCNNRSSSSNNDIPLVIRCLSCDSLNSTTDESLESFNPDIYNAQQQLHDNHHKIITSTPEAADVDGDECKLGLVSLLSNVRKNDGSLSVGAIVEEAVKDGNLATSISTSAALLNGSTTDAASTATATATTADEALLSNLAASTRELAAEAAAIAKTAEAAGEGCDEYAAAAADEGTELMRLLSSAESQRAIKWMIFSHLTYCFPDKQRYPHRSHAEETEYLDRLLFPLSEDGNPQQQEQQKEQQRSVFSLKPSENRELFVYAFMNNNATVVCCNHDGDEDGNVSLAVKGEGNSSSSLEVFVAGRSPVIISEMVMLQIDENSVDLFAGKGSGYKSTCKASQRSSGLQRLMDLHCLKEGETSEAADNAAASKVSSGERLAEGRCKSSSAGAAGGGDSVAAAAAAELDQFWFSPCGYSCNLLIDNSEYDDVKNTSAVGTDGAAAGSVSSVCTLAAAATTADHGSIGSPYYATAHISPESGSSYASVEVSYSFDLSNRGNRNNDRGNSNNTDKPYGATALDYADVLSTFSPNEVNLVELHLWGKPTGSSIDGRAAVDAAVAGAAVAGAAADECHHHHPSAKILGGREELLSAAADSTAGEGGHSHRYRLVDVKEHVNSSWFYIRHSEYRRC